MHPSCTFIAVNGADLSNFKEVWLQDFVGPQDGMWESFRNQASNYGIICNDSMVGYASIGEENQLIQFFVLDEFVAKSNAILNAFIKERNISEAIVGTNNPVFMTSALNSAIKVDVHTYLFRALHEVTIKEKEGIFVQCEMEELDRIVHFYHNTIGASKEWLVDYLGGYIAKGAIFYLQNGGLIVGACEVRESSSNPKYADIGMLVSPHYRKEGYGTFLLHKAKSIAFEWGKDPICSCEKDNMGSFKAITNCGFISKHQLLKITFN